MSEADKIRKKYRDKIRVLRRKDSEIDKKAKYQKMANLYRRKELIAELNEKLKALEDKN